MLYDAFGQREVSTMYTGLNQYFVVMEVDPQYQLSPDAQLTSDIFAPNPNCDRRSDCDLRSASRIYRPLIDEPQRASAAAHAQRTSGQLSPALT